MIFRRRPGFGGSMKGCFAEAGCSIGICSTLFGDMAHLNRGKRINWVGKAFQCAVEGVEPEQYARS